MRDAIGFRIVRTLVLVLLTAFVTFPLFIAVSTALTPFADLSTTFSWLPGRPTLASFVDIWSEMPLGLYFVNSIVVTAGTVAISVPVALAASYAVARYQFPGKKLFMTAILSTQMFPGIFFLIPLFLIFVKIQNVLGLQLVNTQGGLILVYLSFSLPLCIWVLTGYFNSIPRDVEEAGMIDGLGNVAAFVRLVLPTNLGAIVAVAVFATVLSWSEVLFASVLTNNDTQTLSIALSAIVAQPTTPIHWNTIMTGALLASVPIVIAFSLVQKRFVQGLSTGAVKG